MMTAGDGYSVIARVNVTNKIIIVITYMYVKYNKCIDGLVIITFYC